MAATTQPTMTHSETRVLHYLPTHLSAREIADELYVSVNTVKTHQRHLYQKLGARTRTEAVKKARCLGLLTTARLTPNHPDHAIPPHLAAERAGRGMEA
jgi:LuxR family transcriptional regulator, maltose regulon positive regulatory protein